MKTASVSIKLEFQGQLLGTKRKCPTKNFGETRGGSPERRRNDGQRMLQYQSGKREKSVEGEWVRSINLYNQKSNSRLDPNEGRCQDGAGTEN